MGKHEGDARWEEEVSGGLVGGNEKREGVAGEGRERAGTDVCFGSGEGGRHRGRGEARM